jgi:hypothetical protein
MSILRSKMTAGGYMIDNATKPSFFEIIPHLKRALRQAIKDSGLSRDHIADRMNEIFEVESRSR